MKIIVLSILSVAMLTVIPSTIHAQTDEAAIRQVVVNSRASFDKRNLTDFATHFVESPELYYEVSEENGMLIKATGWQAMNHMVGSYMKQHPKPSLDASPLSDIQIHVKGQMAWATAKDSGDLPNESSLGHDFFVLEKQSNQWKIAAFHHQVYGKNKLLVIK